MNSRMSRGAVALSLLTTSVVGVGLLGAGPAQSVVGGPDGFIAYVSHATGAGDIYGVNVSFATPTPTVGSPQVIVSDAGLDDHPAWSPDGNSIAFSAKRGQSQTDIWSLNLGTSVQSRLTEDPARDDHPAFKPFDDPAGGEIAFTSLRSGAGDIWQMEADGSGEALLVGDPGGTRLDEDPMFSANQRLQPVDPTATDTAEVVFRSERNYPPGTSPLATCPVTDIPGGTGNTGDLYTFDDFGCQTPVAATTAAEGTPAMSPDYVNIAFERSGDIWLVNNDNGSTFRLTTHAAVDTHPTFSPDGTKLAFTSFRDGDGEIYVMDLTLSNPEAALTKVTDNTVLDDHADWGIRTAAIPVAPVFSLAANRTVTEGNTGTAPATPMTFTVTATPAPAGPVTVSWSTTGVTTADVLATSGSFSYPAAAASATFTIQVIGDTVDEPDETFTVTIAVPPGNAVGTGSRTGTILDDDLPPPPSFSINDVTVTEGDSGSQNAVFTVTRTGTATGTFSVNYTTATVAGTASAGSDFTATSGILSFPDGADRTIAVPVLGDTIDENDETFTLTLSGASGGATITDADGLGTIVDNDGPPSFSVNDVTATEGDTGTQAAAFTVTRTGSTTGTYTVAYTVTAAAGDTATAGADFVAVASPQTLTFTGPGTQPLNVTVNGDTTDEPDETFTVTLSAPSNGAVLADGVGRGTILDNDAPPAFSVNDVTVTEGDTGTQAAAFTVTRTGTTTGTYTVAYTVTAGSGADAATAGTDFTAVTIPQTLTFTGPGPQPVNVTVNGDTTDENNETYLVTLSAPSNSATLTRAVGVGTIVDNDGPPAFSVNDVTVTEGDTGTQTAAFTVTRTGSTTGTYTVAYTVTATAGDTATAGTDFVAVASPQTLTFTGPGTQTVNATVKGDTAVEGTETFTVTLATPSGGATITRAAGIGTIADNDLEAASGNGSATTDSEGDGATAADPVETRVVHPGGAAITIRESTTPTSGFSIQGYFVEVTAPAVTDPANPIRVEFLIDASLVPAGQSAATLMMTKDGVVVADCAAGNTTAANPNPCLLRAMSGSDVMLTILTTTTSMFGFAPGNLAPATGEGLFLVVQITTTLPAVGGGTLTAHNEDILRYDPAGGGRYELIFDGSKVGLTEAQIDAFAFDGDDMVLSLAGSFKVPGIGTTVDDSDLVRFRPDGLGAATAGTFTVYFDGSDIGLTTGDEDIDALEIVGGDIFFSTRGSFSASSGGSVSGADEDVVACRNAVTGANSACGTLRRDFDGSDVGLGSEDVDGLAAGAGRSYFSTAENFSAGDLSGKDEDVFSCAGSFADCDDSTAFDAFFGGASHGLSGNDIDAIEWVAPTSQTF